MNFMQGMSGYLVSLYVSRREESIFDGGGNRWTRREEMELRMGKIDCLNVDEDNIYINNVEETGKRHGEQE